MKEKLNNRYLMLSLGFIAFGLIILFRLFNLQIVNGEKYNADSQKRVLKESAIKAPRGKILDRYGVPVAVNKQGFTVKIVKTGIDSGEMNAMLLKLAGIFEKNKVSYKNSLSKYLTFNPLSFGDNNEKTIKNWQTNPNRLDMEEKDVKDNPRELFQYLRGKFKINETCTDEQAYKIMVLRYEILIDNWNFTTGGTVSLANDVGTNTISEIEERHHEFPGIITSVEPIREYVNAFDVAQVLGYVRAISQKEYDNRKEEGYKNDDLIGKTGVEAVAERYLRGRDGKEAIEVDTNGRLTRQQETVAAIPGSDVYLTIDRNLQKVAMESLARNIDFIRNKKEDNNFGDAFAGAAVVLDVNSGAILTDVSYPSFDPQIYLAGSEDQAAQAAIEAIRLDNKNKALLNRAIQENYAPGSTFKPLVAVAALEKGVITPTSSNRYDPGRDNYGGKDFFCLEKPDYGHGLLNLKKALETSCNMYFYQIGIDTTIDTLEKWATLFGLGVKTGVDLPGEVTGSMSSKDLKAEKNKDRPLSEQLWRPADTAQTSIGQFDDAFTPLQLANYISTIANGGKRYRPYIIDKVIKYDGSVVNKTNPSYTQVQVKKSTIDAVKEGMVAVTSSIDGTAMKSFQGLPFNVAGKTGTAQTSQLSTHSPNALFVCYAPADKPQIAIAVVVERGAWGSNVAPIARDIIDEYFGLKKANSDNAVLKPEEPLFNP